MDSNTESFERTDRIPEEKLLKKQREKKKSMTYLAAALIIVAMIAGFVLLSAPQEANQPSEDSDNPYAFLYSYLTATETQQSPPPAVTSSAQAYTLPNQSAIPATNAPTSPTVPTSSNAPSAPASSAVNESASETLPQNLPQANGKMHVDLSPDNKFTQIIVKQYGISADILSSVYSLPDTGQNYVLEWTGKKDSSGNIIRNADTLRRCFLIDENGKVKAVAATKSSERENMSAAENRIAMETLIKKVIIPVIEDKLGG